MQLCRQACCQIMLLPTRAKKLSSNQANLAGSATFTSRPVIRVALLLKAMNIHWHMAELYINVCVGCPEPNPY